MSDEAYTRNVIDFNLNENDINATLASITQLSVPQQYPSGVPSPKIAGFITANKYLK